MPKHQRRSKEPHRHQHFESAITKEQADGDLQ